MRGALLILILAAASALAADPPPGVGEKAPEWTVQSWINSEPLSLEDLKGKVVLVRFWTAPSCPYCRNSAPALAHFAKEYGADGLQVVALYHHKAPTPLDPKQVARWAKEYGFTFPVSTDGDWKTLRRWWLDREDNEAAWTSVSFLIDREGIVRHIHPGGQYVEGDDDYAEMEAAIKKWVAE
jgi:peroxiredoxin